MVRRARSALASAVIGMSLASTACIAVLGLEKLSEEKKTAPGSDGGTGESGASETDAKCGDDFIDAESKPAAVDAGDASDLVRYFAFNNLDLDNGGFDLDHIVTIDEATSSCSLPSGVPFARDLASGVDNATRGLLGVIGPALPAFNPTKINERLVNGDFGLLVGINNWNDTGTDDEVFVVLSSTLGISNGKNPAAPSKPPLGIVGSGDASDLWMPDRQLGSASNTAWVNDGKLVARFTTLTLSIRSDLDVKLIDLVLQDAWLTADLSPGPPITLKKGVLGGRVVVSDFLNEVRLLYTGSGYICSSSTAMMTASKAMCGARDIRSKHCEDRQAMPCNALSFGARFETYAVDQLGPPYEQEIEGGPYDQRDLLRPGQRCLDAGDADGAAVACP